MNNKTIPSNIKASLSTNNFPFKVLLLFVYFFIRVIITSYLRIYTSAQNNILAYLGILLYIIVVALTVINKSKLSNNNIDTTSLIFILLFGGLFNVIIYMEYISFYTELFLIMMYPILIVLFLYIRHHSNIYRVGYKWMLLSIIISVLLILFSLAINYNRLSFHINIFDTVAFAVNAIYFMLFSLGNAAIVEEPFYRGFLYGIIRDAGYGDVVIVLSQAILFWISHIYHYNDINYFFIITPIFGIVLGYIALKSKSILPTIIIHTIYNTVSLILGQYIQ